MASGGEAGRISLDSEESSNQRSATHLQPVPLQYHTRKAASEPCGAQPRRRRAGSPEVRRCTLWQRGRSAGLRCGPHTQQRDAIAGPRDAIRICHKEPRTGRIETCYTRLSATWNEPRGLPGSHCGRASRQPRRPRSGHPISRTTCATRGPMRWSVTAIWPPHCARAHDGRGGGLHRTRPAPGEASAQAEILQPATERHGPKSMASCRRPRPKYRAEACSQVQAVRGVGSRKVTGCVHVALRS